ncbi:hypothetical protein JQX13_38090 [Archangium violaceum]|uniref:hypothetical protein n=1 Tax=Archangium violaceum TaxID=83451 RepID=UPI00193BD821|nr:hypothetical protein [Archangium violaceum]QRK05908.1 hypothetical protein JQX13_38090 [Archangium violaceum]
MKRGMRRVLTMGLLTGGLLVVGCGNLSEETGRPHTPIQNKYQDGAAGAASELDGREGFNMPDWQNHPTMGQGEEEALQGPTGADSRLEPQTPLISAPEEAYQAADDVLAPRSDEGTPQVETVPGQPDDEQAIGGAGNAGQQDAGTRR